SCLDGYEICSSNRTEHVGGGVASYVNKEYNSYEVHDPLLCNKDVEPIWCGIAINGDLIFVGCFHRPPGHNANDVKINLEVKNKSNIYTNIHCFQKCFT
ncbi:unnamed protein product, partial [Brachionus calyciflorus]